MEPELNDGITQPNELDLLKERADLMGIKYHPNIGIDKLKEKIQEKQAGGAKDEGKVDYAQEELDTIEEGLGIAAASDQPVARLTPAQQRIERRNRALRLVRVRVTCMNPLKGNMSGDIFQAGNAEIGVVKKYIPFNAEQGWHIPQILLTMLQSKRFMTHYTTKVNGKDIKRNKLVPEYSIEILPPLTAKELDELRQRQLMAAGK